jgi:hypothetical protein
MSLRETNVICAGCNYDCFYDNDAVSYTHQEAVNFVATMGPGWRLATPAELHEIRLVGDPIIESWFADTKIAVWSSQPARTPGAVACVVMWGDDESTAPGVVVDVPADTALPMSLFCVKEI